LAVIALFSETAHRYCPLKTGHAHRIRLYYQRLQSGSLAEVLADAGYGQPFSEVR
jgi:hypothetical protein